MNMPNRRRLVGAAFGAAIISLPGVSSAAETGIDYPVDTVTAITYSSVGGGTDVFLREMSKFLGPIMGVNIVVDNVTGGGGAPAMARVANAPKDGSVVLGTTITIINTSIIHNPEYKWDDLDMIVMYAIDPSIMYVRADSQFESFEQLIEYAKANPGKLQFGLPNPTAMDRWVIEQLKKKIDGFDVNAVSFEGGGDVMLSVLNGTVDVANGEPSELGDQITAGKLRPLAVWTEERLDIMPDLPTAKEQGVDLVVNKFRGIAGPKGLPPEIHEAWLKGIQLATEKPEFKAWLDAGGVNVTFKNHEEYTAFMQNLAEEQAAFFAEIGLTN